MTFLLYKVMSKGHVLPAPVLFIHALDMFKQGEKNSALMYSKRTAVGAKRGS